MDTANQRKHYFEEGAGDALAEAYSVLGLRREDIFVQTKFTYARGQDHRRPYDDNLPLYRQVEQSFESSLQNLKTDYLDSYILHGPSEPTGFSADDLTTWDSMEDLAKSGRVRWLGVSNVTLDQLAKLCESATVQPAFVQNRCLAQTRWDQEVRHFCTRNGIRYQGFSLLTNNWKYLGGTVTRPENRNVPQLLFLENELDARSSVHPEVLRIVQGSGKTIQQVVFRFAQQIGIIPIVGTRSEIHMKLDREIKDFELSARDLEDLENIASLS